ncbi:MAG: antitoxin [Clostridia bacterium]|nr:antitoxin [Clostridia bacterium]
MRTEYDFSEARKNPYVQGQKKQITIDMDAETLEYYQTLAAETNIPYQTLISLCLSDCAAQKKRPTLP